MFATEWLNYGTWQPLHREDVKFSTLAEAIHRIRSDAGWWDRFRVVNVKTGEVVYEQE